MEKNMKTYCGTRNKGSAPASPVPEYTCVRYTCDVAVGTHEMNLWKYGH